MREGLGAFQRAALLCSVLAFAIAAPAIADDSKDSEVSEDSEGSTAGGIRRYRIFEEYDTDGDGRLTKDERAAARKKHYEKHVQKFDTDGDGKLSETERGVARKEQYSRHVEQFDTDGDGKLSEEEREAAREKRSNRRDQALERFDADGDGQLTGEEREQAQAARRMRNGRRGRGPGDRPAADQPGDAPEAP